MPQDIDLEVKIAQQEIESAELIATVEKLGKISKLTCPDCQGALWEIKDRDILRYRCHVGHAYSAESLGEGQKHVLEFALWSAVRALEEDRGVSINAPFAPAYGSRSRSRDRKDRTFAF